MRIRNAALAGATAIAVAFGGTTIATAAETTDGSSYTGIFSGSSNDKSNSTGETDRKGSLSSKIDLDNNEPTNGRDIFGSSKDFSNVPAWAKALYAATIVGGLGTLVGGIIGPVYNFIVHGPFAR
ncbi:hypothetical protein ACL1EX_00850 [Corynebacterium striatum]